MYHVHFDEAARQELNQRAHQPGITPRTRDRLEMLRLSDASYSIPQIATHLGCHEQTVRHWIKVFLLDGFDALTDPPRPGKASAITKDILAQVRAWIEKADRIWSAGQIALEVERVYGIRRGKDRWRRLLKQEGLTYKRTSRHLNHKQNQAQVRAKQSELEALQKRGCPGRSISPTKTKPGSP